VSPYRHRHYGVVMADFRDFRDFLAAALFYDVSSSHILLRHASLSALSSADTVAGLRGPPLPPRRWSLGRYGLAINIISLCFILPLLFFAFWPVATPVTA
jgi:hypothetical protein